MLHFTLIALLAVACVARGPRCPSTHDKCDQKGDKDSMAVSAIARTPITDDLNNIRLVCDGVTPPLGFAIVNNVLGKGATMFSFNLTLQFDPAFQPCFQFPTGCTNAPGCNYNDIIVPAGQLLDATGLSVQRVGRTAFLTLDRILQWSPSAVHTLDPPYALGQFLGIEVSGTEIGKPEFFQYNPDFGQTQSGALLTEKTITGQSQLSSLGLVKQAALFGSASSRVWRFYPRNGENQIFFDTFGQNSWIPSDLSVVFPGTFPYAVLDGPQDQAGAATQQQRAAGFQRMRDALQQIQSASRPEEAREAMSVLFG